MALENCSRCGKLFHRISKPLCPDCLVEAEKLAEKVVEYLRRHSGATLTEIADATGVDEAFVLDLLRDGRIEMASDVRPVLFCRACGGASIESGVYCAKCLDKFGKAFSGRGGCPGGQTGLGRGGDDGEKSRYKRAQLGGERASGGARMSVPERRRKGRE